MNAGFREGKRLAEFYKKILQEDAPLSCLDAYNQEETAHWRQLLGLTGGLQAGEQTDQWVSAHRAKLLSCLPGCGPDLAALAQSLNLKLAQNEALQDR